MPFYEYECPNCKFYTEVMQKISDAPLDNCPSCGKNALKKLVSAPVFRLKGAGWYETDFKSDKEKKRNLGPTEEAKPEAKAETKGETKPRRRARRKPTPRPMPRRTASRTPGRRRVRARRGRTPGPNRRARRGVPGRASPPRAPRAHAEDHAAHAPLGPWTAPKPGAPRPRGGRCGATWSPAFSCGCRSSPPSGWCVSCCTSWTGRCCCCRRSTGPRRWSALRSRASACCSRSSSCSSPDSSSPISSGAAHRWGEELLNRVPVVRSVYGGVKSFTESVLSQSNSFRKVVMVQYPRTGVWSIGFMTAEDVPEVSERPGSSTRPCTFPPPESDLRIHRHRAAPRGDRAADVGGRGHEDDRHLRGRGAAGPRPRGRPGGQAGRLIRAPRGGCGGAIASVTSRASCVHITADTSTSGSSARKSRSPAGCTAGAITAA